MTSPDLDRSWVRRALVSPPVWGSSIPDVWKDAEAIFSRPTPSPDGYGGFTHTTATFLTVPAVIYQTHEDPFSLATGVVKRVVVKALIDLDDIPNPDSLPLTGLVPRKGDTMTYTDPLGETFKVLVDRVENPGELNDHLEINCWEFV